MGKHWATTEDLSFRTPDSATWAKVRCGASTPKWMPYRRQILQDARRSRPSHSRSEVLSLTRSDHGAVRQRPESRFDGKITVPGTSPPAPMCCIGAYQPHDRCTLPVQADITDQLSVCGAQRARQDALSYCRSSSRSSSIAAPKTVPSNVPVFVKSLTLLSAANTTGVNVEFNVRAPDAPLKRPVPPVI